MEFLIGNSNIGDLKNIIFAAFLSIIAGVIINIIYRLSNKGVITSTSFANTLSGLTVVSYFVIRCVTNNTLLSLGMVGALSIVRFRNSVKDPQDIMFAFWAIAEGIILGAQDFLLAGTFLVAMSVITLFLNGTNCLKNEKKILIIRYENKTNKEELEKIFKNIFVKYHIKEITLASINEMIVEVKTNKKEVIDVEKIKIEGVNEVSLVDVIEPLV